MSTNAPYDGPYDGPAADGPAADGRHPVHVTHLVMGLVFLGIVVVWALVEAGLVGGDDVRWLLPVPWVLAGGAGLLATTLSARRRREVGGLRAADPFYPADPSYPADPFYPADPADPADSTEPTEEIR